MFRKNTVILATIFVYSITCSQEVDTTVSSNSINYSRVAVVSAVAAGTITLAHIQSYNSWWKGERSKFRIHDEGAYALGADKLGHLYFSYLSSDMLGRSLEWSGVKSRNAFLFGAVTSLAFELYVEVEDGFTKSLGFSPGDALADAGGALYPFLRNEYPVLKNFNYKISIFPSSFYREGRYRTIIDDYESIYYWISIDRNIAPKLFESFIPKFFTIAVGYSVKEITKSGTGFPELFISLDYDFEKLPGDGSFICSLKHLLNYIHFPAPAIRISPNLIFYGLKF
ncbi:MAG: DUF2279 domain-containing protein [Ignavibacteriales bacterium]|nr:DUF2279 domain-containing protein [Ignavibacteriales bacterium]